MIATRFFLSVLLNSGADPSMLAGSLAGSLAGYAVSSESGVTPWFT